MIAPGTCPAARRFCFVWRRSLSTSWVNLLELLHLHRKSRLHRKHASLYRKVMFEAYRKNEKKGKRTGLFNNKNRADNTATLKTATTMSFVIAKTHSTPRAMRYFRYLLREAQVPGCCEAQTMSRNCVSHFRIRIALWSDYHRSHSKRCLWKPDFTSEDQEIISHQLYHRATFCSHPGHATRLFNVTHK